MLARASLFRAMAPLGLAAVLAGCGEGPWAHPGPHASEESVGRAHRSQVQAAHHFGLPLMLRNALGIEFRLVPPGQFLMGSPPGEQGRGGDETPHRVHLPVPYYLQASEVTWAQVARWRPALLERAGETPHDRPAQGLTHEEATEFADWANGLDPHLFHRLPTEAEWEHACRAGARGPWGVGHPSGGAGSGGLGDGASGASNAWGLRTMHGGVAEWCRGWYAPYESWATDLPMGPLTGSERVARGGSVADPAASQRCAARARLSPGARDLGVGLRLLMEVGYAVPGLGPHELTVRSFVGSDGSGGGAEVQGYRLRMVSVPERLSARQEDRAIRWVHLEGVTPLTLHMLPGRYYFQAWRETASGIERGLERKCTIPEDLPEFAVEAPVQAR